jgi:predicted hotdog family 3-hydroxylacyl-ACP dehydratase
VSDVPGAPAPSLDGRRFQAVADVPGGDVSAQTVFEYAEETGLVHARYGGGAIRLGFLVGTRDGDTLRFRYAQVRADGSTASGRCESRIEVLEDGRLRLHETWAWESQPGEGTSSVDEVI